jgi:hypothetical protein
VDFRVAARRGLHHQGVFDMSYHHDHQHTKDVHAQFRTGRTPESYAAVVGTVDQSSEHPITGRNGDHLQFYLLVGGGSRYQVDVNTQSSDGSEIGVYMAEQDLSPSGSNPDEPFGAPAYGVFPDAQLSYKAMGLKDADFVPLPYYRIDGQLTAALNGATFATAYGVTFDDGGPDGKGVHDTHFSPKTPNEDGAIAVYSVDQTSGKPTRTWFFFKFQNQKID